MQLCRHGIQNIAETFPLMLEMKCAIVQYNIYNDTAIY